MFGRASYASSAYLWDDYRGDRMIIVGTLLIFVGGDTPAPFLNDSRLCSDHPGFAKLSEMLLKESR